MTSSYRMEMARGMIRANEYNMAWIPNPRRPADKAPAILLHMSGAPMQYAESTRIHSLTVGAFLAWQGIPSVAGEMSGQSWGNDAAMTDIDKAFTYAKSKFGLTATKFHLIGASMGGFVGARYATLFPEKVASFTGLIPLLDLNAFYNAVTPGAYKNEISTAWGVANDAPLPAGATLNLAALKNVVSSRVYYASNDTVVNPSTMTLPGATAMGAATVDVGALGHTENAIGAALARGGGYGGEVIGHLFKNGA